MGSRRRLNPADERRRRAALAEWAADATGHASPADVVAAAAALLAERVGLPVDHDAAPPLLRDRSRDGAGLEPAAGLVVDAWDLGIVHEATHDPSSRRSRGVHYTPRSVASGLAAIALEGAHDTSTVCDPAVGGGAFLLAAAEVLHGNGASRADVLGRLRGIDVDPLAVAVAEASLALWAATGGRWSVAAPQLVVADTLDARTADRAPGGVADVVIGNPPFQSQLTSGTARDTATTADLRRRWGVDAGPYCDTAGWFLLAALELAASDGRIALVLPQSLLASADAAPVREHLARRTTLTGLWTGESGVFDADVRVFAPVLEVGSAPARSARTDTVRWWSGPDVVAGAPIPAPTAPGRWSELVARAAGVPAVESRASTPLGSWCEATAGFRDQFYGLAPHTVEYVTQGGDDAEHRSGGHPDIAVGSAPLVTVGMIEPLRCRWGSGTTYRYAGRRWTSPAVDLAVLEEADPALARWVGDRLRPKVLVATQTRVVEAVVDVDGRWIPSTPTIAVTAPPERLWHLAAALTSPVATAAALAASAGTALSHDAIKLSARQVLGLPTPVRQPAWDEGARLAEAVACGWVDRGDGLAELGRVMIDAAGSVVDEPDALFGWWWARLPQV